MLCGEACRVDEWEHARVRIWRATVLALCLASSCASIPQSRRASARLADYFARHREVAPLVAAAMNQGHLLVGMDHDQVWAVLGDPVRRTRFSHSEVWLYPGHRLHQGHLRTQGSTLFRLVFINGRLAVIEPL